MASWMHFIGKGYYNISKFVKEAKRYGITRRVSLTGAGACNMSWGDEVICLQKEPGLKSYSVICEFPITRFVGITEAARNILSEACKVEQTDEEPQVVERECGSYETVGSYVIDAKLSDAAKMLKKAREDGIDVGKVMVGCYAWEIKFYEKPYPKVGGFTQNQGFRAYNREKFMADLFEKKAKGQRLVLQGTYYTKAGDLSDGEGIVAVVKDYLRIEEINRIEKAKAVLKKAGVITNGQLELL